MEINTRTYILDIFKQFEEEYYQDIERYSNDIIMANNNTEIIEDLLSKKSYSTIEISPELLEERSLLEKEIDNPFYHEDFGRMLDKIKGFHCSFTHRFTGSFELLQYRATTTLLWHPDNIEIFGDKITFYYDIPYTEDTEKMMQEVLSQYNKDIDKFKVIISHMNDDINKFNNEIKEKLDKKITEKRKRISVLNEFSKKMAIPLNKSSEAPNLQPIKVIKKTKPLTTKVIKEDEYYIPDEDYNEILRRIRHIGSSMERVPSTYTKLKEEELRNVIVSQLNVDYEGEVQGESFRNNGKTDICIEYKNRAAFVAECKIWKGKNTLQSTIDQLLGYTTWKDSKLAIILFNKNNKDFFNVINVINDNIKEIKNYYNKVENNKNEIEVILNSNNVGQLIKIRIFIFNLYNNKDS